MRHRAFAAEAQVERVRAVPAPKPLRLALVLPPAPAAQCAARQRQGCDLPQPRRLAQCAIRFGQQLEELDLPEALPEQLQVQTAPGPLQP